jgi:hypothetical protein
MWETSTPAIVGAGSKQVFPASLPKCQKLLLTPEEPKLAAELGGMRRAALGLPCSHVSQALVWGKGQMKAEEI